MSVNDTIEIALEHFLSSTDRLADAFAAVDDPGVDELLRICKERGIDPLPALRLALVRGDLLMSLIGDKQASIVNTKQFRIPLQVKHP